MPLFNKVIILDVDGTLSDVSHRVHHVRHPNRNWNQFFAEMHLDPTNEPVAWLARTLFTHGRCGQDFGIIVVSARPDDYRAVTETWLADNGIEYHGLYMRKGGDFRKDSIVKVEILQQIIDDGYEPILAIDDRASVANECWRAMGITCLQCEPDEVVESKYSGQTLFHMMVGPAGAGKSTYIAQHYRPSDVISTDDIREQLFGDRALGHDPESLARTWRYAHGLVRTRLDNGIFTVLDATNVRRKDRLNALASMPEGQLAQYVLIDRPLDDKLATRGARSEELILKHHRIFQGNLKELLQADQQGNVIVVDKRIK